MARSRAVVVASVVAAASVLGWWLGEQRRTAEPQVRVVRAIDGDTIVVARPGGARETIRILGVDTPETHDPRKPVQCYGPEAAAYTAARLTGRVVQLEDDVETRDVYGRHLAYVRVDGHLFEDELLDRGFARFLVIAPNGAHARAELSEELAARRQGQGLWGRCRGGT
jgi:micrococcal nuclease